MGFEQQSLLGGEDLELTPFDKEKITNNVRATYRRAKLILPIFAAVAVGAAIAMFICAIVFRGGKQLIFLITGPSLLFLALFYAVMSWVLAKRFSSRQAEATELFREIYIGSWTFEKHSWETFAKWNFKQSLKDNIALWCILALLMVAGCILFVVMAIFTNMSIGQNFAVSWVPLSASPLLIVVIVMGILLYRRYRGFRRDVHCCVLGRGTFYQMGTMVPLQPATSYTVSTIYNLLSVHFEKRSVGELQMNILTINMKTRGKHSDMPATVMVPVPEVFTQRVISWIPTFVNGYTTEYTINLEDVIPMSKKMQPTQPVHHVTVTKDDITM